MFDIDKHIIFENDTIHFALERLNYLAQDSVLFIVNEDNQLIASLTDGDIRRGLLKGLTLDDSLRLFINFDVKFIEINKISQEYLNYLRNSNYRIVPVINGVKEIIRIINFRIHSSLLPIDVVFMAGGLGKRLRPLTDNIPKPLLPVGDKSIIEHNIFRLERFGIQKIYITINYFADKVIEFFYSKNFNEPKLYFIKEEKVLGTIGALSLINDFSNDTVLIMNSDLLTNLNFEDFYFDFKKHDADISILSIPYSIELPYAIFEFDANGKVLNLKEKPTYIYRANGGIYLIKRSILNLIPKDEYFNATDLIDVILKNNGKVITFKSVDYWLDIGRIDDYNKAQEDIKHLKL